MRLEFVNNATQVKVISPAMERGINSALGVEVDLTEGAHVFLRHGDTPVASPVHTDSNAATGVVLHGRLAYTTAVPLFEKTCCGGKTKADSTLNALLRGEGIGGEPVIINADEASH